MRLRGGAEGGPARRLGYAAGCGTASVLLLAGAAAAGESAAVPGLGPGPGPAWDAALHPPSALVTVLLVIAYGLGAAAVWLGLRVAGGPSGPPAGEGSAGRTTAGRFAGRRVAAASLAAVALFVVVPPLGSADHLSYAAYGRIAAAGDDPYTVAPDAWRDGRDPVAGAVQPPWRSTPSVYGPVATAAFAAVADAGGGSLRRTIWLWQLVAGAGFLAVAGLLDLLTRHDARARARAAVLWTLNPVLLGQLVLGAHLDVLAAALALGVIATARRWPLAAGVLLGLAAGTKLPYAVVGVAAVWGLRRLPVRRLAGFVLRGAVGALAVLVPAHLWAGPHVFDQLGRAGRMVSLATPWRVLVDGAGLLVGSDTARAAVTPLAGLLALALAWRLARRSPWAQPAPTPASLPAGPSLDEPPDEPSPDGPPAGPSVDEPPAGPSVDEPLGGGPEDPAVVRDTARAAVLLSVAWVLTAPYALPWYDALVWAPLALAGASWLDGVLLVRLLTLAVAYVPGRVVGMSPVVEAVTLGIRRGVAPLVAVGVLVVVVRRTRRPARRT